MDTQPPVAFARRTLLRRLGFLLSALLVFLLFGLLMKWWTQSIARQENARGLLPEISVVPGNDTLARQLSLLGLGGLRSLSAEILGLDAVQAWSARDWNTLETRYRQMTTLCPLQTSYWITGARHMAYNAAGDALSDNSLPSWEKDRLARGWFHKGIRFLREAMEFNPASPLLHARLGDFLSDLNRRPDFAASAAAYRRAVELGAADLYRRMEFYALCRVPGKEKEAWKLGCELFLDEQHRQPSLLCCLFALQNKLDLPREQRFSIAALFGNDARALRLLSSYLHNRLRYPTDGVAAEVAALRKRLPAGATAEERRADSLARAPFLLTRPRFVLPESGGLC